MATLAYRGYNAVMEVDLDAGELFGRTLGMRDIITFQGRTVEEARKSFEESVDFYLACCREEGKIPDRSYSGRFNVRIPPELHRCLVNLADCRGQSLNELVSASLAATVAEAFPGSETPTPTWQEVKAKLDSQRAKRGVSRNGEPRRVTSKSAGRARN